ncbi:MAG: hypothetical protein M3373_03880 [Gemmatimonadota bacterium]|nr:hypothetical protein [Gemmatimonadota bacterium]
MAEIRVEPKRGGLGWLWVVIALIVIAFLAWYFLSDRGTDAPVTDTGLAIPTATMLASVRGPSASLAA